MNKIVSKFVLTGEKIMPKLDLLTVLLDCLLNIVKEFKNFLSQII